MPQLYGLHGDTAAEFIVSAGLDTSKSSSVRIRKLGNPANQNFRSSGASSDNSRINDSRFNEVLVSRNRVNEFSNAGRPRIHPQQTSSRRQDSPNRRNPGFGAPFNLNQGYQSDLNIQRYVPPIFVPNYQQFHSPRPFFIPNNPQPNSQVLSAKSAERHTTSQGNLLRNAEDKVNGFPTPEKVNGNNYYNSSKYFNISNEKDKPDLQKDNFESSPPKIKNNLVAETPVLRLDDSKSPDFPNSIIRRPFLILKDQITVNEVSKSSSQRTRFGPRSLHIEENSSGNVRRKRETSILNVSEEDNSMDSTNSEQNQKESSSKEDKKQSEQDNSEYISAKPVSNSESDIKWAFQEFGRRHQRGSRNFPARKIYRIEKDKEFEANSTVGNYPELMAGSSFYGDSLPLEEEYNLTDSSTEKEEGEVMSFSDFLASPIAEKIRLERQFFFRNYSTEPKNLTEPITKQNTNSKVDYESFLKTANISLLREIIAARLLHGLLNIEKNSSEYLNTTAINPSDNIVQRSSDGVESAAEQRQFGIVVSPYDGLESIGSKSSMPAIRILKGRIVSLPELPKELIPIILGTYKPSQITEAPLDDTRFTENMLDNAILKLLQSEEGMSSNNNPMPYRKVHQSFNRKSPSINYVGSMKTPHHQNYFKPADWAIGPRCDRLTEEICLDDSDYPSSAIMSSIYKDKPRFDLMYAEVKVRESQVEGLSRQQEQSYTYDHYYGPYAQASGSNPMTRDYGHGGGFVCPSEVHYGKPHRAKNRKGEWKVVVNVGEYTQTLRMEKCLASGNPCMYVVSHMQSICSQVYSYHRLLVFSKDNGLHIDLFRVPTACSCHLRKGYSQQRPGQYDDYGGHVETAPHSVTEAGPSANNEKKNSFGNTLWSILGGGPQASMLAQQPQFLDEVQKQISWTQQLKQFPHVLKQISPNQVLKQLLEDDDENYNIRRQRIRPKPQPGDRGTSAGFASHHVPFTVPLPPPPPPPPMIIARRPVISAAIPSHKPSDKSTNIVTISPPEPSNSDGHNVRFSSPYRPSGIAPPTIIQELKAYKIYPGMHHSTNNRDKYHFGEGSLVPVAPQFSDSFDSESLSSGRRPIIKPMPVPKESVKQIVDDDDLLAVEKSEGDVVHAFQLETVEDDSNEESENQDGSKINFSYHPILEYLNLQL